MGNFGGWLQRTENSAVNNALSHLVTDRRDKNKDVLNSFSSLLGNCYLMAMTLRTQKIPFLPIPVSLGKWEVSKLSKGRFCTCPSFPQLQFGSEHLLSVFFFRSRQSFNSACAAAELRMCWVVAPFQGWHLEPSLSWAVLGHFGVKALLEVRGCVAIQHSIVAFREHNVENSVEYFLLDLKILVCSSMGTSSVCIANVQIPID